MKSLSWCVIYLLEIFVDFLENMNNFLSSQATYELMFCYLIEPHLLTRLWLTIWGSAFDPVCSPDIFGTNIRQIEHRPMHLNARWDTLVSPSLIPW